MKCNKLNININFYFYIVIVFSNANMLTRGFTIIRPLVSVLRYSRSNINIHINLYFYAAIFISNINRLIHDLTIIKPRNCMLRYSDLWKSVFSKYLAPFASNHILIYSKTKGLWNQNTVMKSDDVDLWVVLMDVINHMNWKFPLKKLAKTNQNACINH